MKKIFIAGSCVTRDAFSYASSEDFSCREYVARYSLARLVFPKLESFNLDQTYLLEKVPSAFQRKMLNREWNNELLSLISSTSFDYLIIDCVDERFGLVEAAEGVYITNSDELRASQVLNTLSVNKILPDSKDFSDNWESAFKKILEIVPVRKIIINNVFWAKKLEDGTNFDGFLPPGRVEWCNQVVSKLYKIASKYIPKNQFVNYPEEIFVGSSNHKWGKSPFHYTDDVYLYLINFLNKLSS